MCIRFIYKMYNVLMQLREFFRSHSTVAIPNNKFVKDQLNFYLRKNKKQNRIQLNCEGKRRKKWKKSHFQSHRNKDVFAS